MKTIIVSLLYLLCGTTIVSQNISFTSPDPQSIVDGAAIGDLELGDIDGDGDLDLFVTGRPAGVFSEASSAMYLNDGEGNFTKDESFSIQGLEGAAAVFSDFDMDGDLDLLVNGIPGNNGYFVGLYLNDGLGQFTLEPDVPFIASANGDVAAGDVDGDGYKDVFVSGNTLLGRASTLYINDGFGNFTEAVGSTFIDIAGQAEFVDIDGDNDLDLISSGDPSTAIHVNDGSGVFTPLSIDFSNVRGRSFALGDLDNDGDVDLLLTGQQGAFNIITDQYLNDGSGNFTLFEDSTFPTTDRGKTAFADFDTDGDLDVLLSGNIEGSDGVFTHKTLLFENKGSNTFIQSDSLRGSIQASVAIGDINGDLLDDLVLSGDNLDEAEFDTWFYLNTSETSVGLSEVSEYEEFVKVFPNPSAGVFNIRLANKEYGLVEIYNATGQLVYETAITDSQNRVDLQVPSGFYSIIVRDSNTVKSQRVLILR